MLKVTNHIGDAEQKLTRRNSGFHSISLSSRLNPKINLDSNFPRQGLLLTMGQNQILKDLDV